MNNPRHVAIIMDGNGRWATSRGMKRYLGHRSGANKIRALVDFAASKNINVLSIFAMSSENFLFRPKEEVGLLANLFVEMLKKNLKDMCKKGVKIRFIGDPSVFSTELRSLIYEAEQATENNDRITLIIAINYSGRWDILQAARASMQSLSEGAELTETIFSQHLSTCGVCDPDLLIRTGGDKRISNFFLWQSAYTELYFTPVLWPDFNISEFSKALAYYQQCQRRFGTVEVE
jgi:undecaprenyl diphosphate synthase